MEEEGKARTKEGRQIVCYTEIMRYQLHHVFPSNKQKKFAQTLPMLVFSNLEQTYPCNS